MVSPLCFYIFRRDCQSVLVPTAPCGRCHRRRIFVAYVVVSSGNVILLCLQNPLSLYRSHNNTKMDNRDNVVVNLAFNNQ